MNLEIGRTWTKTKILFRKFHSNITEITLEKIQPLQKFAKLMSKPFSKSCSPIFSFQVLLLAGFIAGIIELVWFPLGFRFQVSEINNQKFKIQKKAVLTLWKFESRHGFDPASPLEMKMMKNLVKLGNIFFSNRTNRRKRASLLESTWNIKIKRIGYKIGYTQGSKLKTWSQLWKSTAPLVAGNQNVIVLYESSAQYLEVHWRIFWFTVIFDR